MKRSKPLEPYLFREGSVSAAIPSLTLGVIGRTLNLLDTFLKSVVWTPFDRSRATDVSAQTYVDSRG